MFNLVSAPPRRLPPPIALHHPKAPDLPVCLGPAEILARVWQGSDLTELTQALITGAVAVAGADAAATATGLAATGAGAGAGVAADAGAGAGLGAAGAAAQRSALLLARCQGARTPLSTSVAAIVPYVAISELGKTLIVGGDIDSSRVWTIVWVVVFGLGMRAFFGGGALIVTHFADVNLQAVLRRRGCLRRRAARPAAFSRKGKPVAGARTIQGTPASSASLRKSGTSTPSSGSCSPRGTPRSRTAPSGC